MTARNRMFVPQNEEDFAVIGVPEGKDGDDMRKYLHRQELVGECRLNFTGHKNRHDDGRLYEDVAIISTHRTDPKEIACGAMSFHPGWNDGDEMQEVGLPCPFCKGQGCRECGHTGVQA